MSPRFSLALAASLALLAVAACAGTPGAPSSPSSPEAPAVVSPRLTPVPVANPTQSPGPVASPIIGDVDGSAGGPELIIETLAADTIQATLEDPDAKAWRLVVAGRGELGEDRWEIVVETGDVGPAITATEFRSGVAVDTLDLTGFWDDTAAVGGCHSTLPVCLGSDGFRVPEGDGIFSVRLDLPEGQVPLVIRGGTAGWPGEPFILGDWHDTEPFAWGEG
jgi:hypothetical protein